MTPRRSINKSHAEPAIPRPEVGRILHTIRVESLPFINCEKCGAKLGVSPNSKGAFSYQGCNCDQPEWMQQQTD